MKSGIYWIVGPNGKAYIGSSQNVKKRLSVHRYELRRGVHKNSHLQRAVNKHGIDAFTFAPLEFCAIERLIEREQFYIDSFNFDTLYNARPIADSNRGHKHTPEVRAVVGEHARKRLAAPDARAAHSERLRNAWANPEKRAAQSERSRQQWASSKARTAQSERKQTYWASSEARIAQSNRASASRNTSGYKGVTRSRARWLAQMTIDGKHRYLGVYATPELAYAWRLAYLAHLEYA